MIEHLDSWKLHIQLSGSVSLPVRAAAAATTGLVKYTLALEVPDLPWKFRLLVRTETESVRETCCFQCKIPGRFQYSGPECYQVAEGPFRAMAFKTCRDPGAIPKETPSGSFFPLTILATVIRST